MGNSVSDEFGTCTNAQLHSETSTAGLHNGHITRTVVVRRKSVPSANHDSPGTLNDSSQPLLTPKKPPRYSDLNVPDRVRFILSGSGANDDNDSDDEDREFDAQAVGEHYVFCQMDSLCHFEDGTLGWKEMSRWLKYEEKVEPGDRWSKPHVATTSLHALTEIRKAVADGTALVELDIDSSLSVRHGTSTGNEILTRTIAEMAELLMATLKSRGMPSDQADKVYDVLVRPHKHQHRHADKDKLKTKAELKKAAGKTEDVKKLDRNENEEGKKKKKLKKKDDLDDILKWDHMYPGRITPDDLKPYKPNKKLLGKIPSTAEVASIMVGTVDFLDAPLNILVRLTNPIIIPELTEVYQPTRFLFIGLAPEGHTSIYELEETGRAMAAFYSDKVFAEVAYRATTRQDIIDGMDVFMDRLTVLPPSLWDPKTRLEPPSKTLSTDQVRKRLIKNNYGGEPTPINFEEAVSGDPSLEKTGRPFGGMIRDMKARYSLYWSDIKDGLSISCLASIVFLYFACITPIVTFGGLLGTATGGLLGTMESILSGAICGLSFAVFSGQPLTIVGATGPLLIFETLLFDFCEVNGIDFLSFRFWTGLWITAALVLMVVFDLSYLVKYITRFTEESFSLLISLIFIIEAFKKVIHVMDYNPVDTDTLYDDKDYLCHCVAPPNNGTAANETHTILDNWTDESDNSTDDKPAFFTHVYNWTSEVGPDCINYQGKVVVSYDCVHLEDCGKHGWVLEGPACDDNSTTMAVPDIFFFSVFIFLATFSIAYFFRNFRTAPYFNQRFRSTIADFAVFLSIIICTSIDLGVGINTPKLRVPEEFKTTVDGRGWIVNPMALLPYWYLIILSIIPALLATILIFLDQQITAVIINRKDHKLLKPPGYHLDLFVLAVITFICSLLGLPWFVAATVRSLTHVKSLIKQTEISAPGEKPTMLGVREQRVTAFVIHVLIGVSVLMTGILKYVPMPVLYGVFLYMGVTSLQGVQFVERVKILAMPPKYQPDTIYLRHVPLKRIHIFTAIQIAGMVGMWVVKSISAVAIAFPLLVLALCFVRKGMDYFFTQGELYWLDHILPDEDRRKKEDELKKDSASKDSEETEPLAPWPADEKDEKSETNNAKQRKVKV